MSRTGYAAHVSAAFRPIREEGCHLGSPLLDWSSHCGLQEFLALGILELCSEK